LPGDHPQRERKVRRPALASENLTNNQLRPTIALRGWSNITLINSNMAVGGHFKKWLECHNLADDRLITTKFGRQMQYGMPMTINTSKSKRDIQFQYGGCPFSKTGSSFISAVN